MFFSVAKKELLDILSKWPSDLKFFHLNSDLHSVVFLHTRHTCEEWSSLHSSAHTVTQISGNAQQDTCCPNKWGASGCNRAVCCSCLIRLGGSSDCCASQDPGNISFLFSFFHDDVYFTLWWNHTSHHAVLPEKLSRKRTLSRGYWHSQLEQMLSYMIKCTRTIRDEEQLWLLLLRYCLKSLWIIFLNDSPIWVNLSSSGRELCLFWPLERPILWQM